MKNEIYERFVKDEFKDTSYFLNKLEEINERIGECQTTYENGMVKNFNIYWIHISRVLLEKIEILRTLGESHKEIKKVVVEYCNAIENIPDSHALTYNNVKNVLSLAYLYNLDMEKIEFIKNNMIKDTWIDAPLDMLVNGIFYNKPSTTKDFCFKLTLSGSMKKTNGEFMNIVNAKNEKEKNITFVEYLKTTKESFYKKQLKEYARVGEDRYTYTGSCDFMLTALAKMLNIDKKLLIDSKFIDISLL